MEKKIKIGLIVLAVGLILVSGWFVVLDDCQRCVLVNFGSIGGCDRVCHPNYPLWSDKEITIQPKDISCSSESIRKQADYLGLSCKEFNILSASVRGYLYEKYPFTRDTDFGIRYEREENQPEHQYAPSAIIVEAAANFRTPPVVVRVAFYDEKVYFISEKVINEW